MVKGHKIVVKTMPEGTPFQTLDGEEHKLSDRDLAICNAEEPMCIAGVFGGKGSGTYETTKNVVLESASSTLHGFASQHVVTDCLPMLLSASSVASTPMALLTPSCMLPSFAKS